MAADHDIAGYVATGVVSLSVGLLVRQLEPKSKLVLWSPHNFFFDLKDVKVALQTNSLTIQNIGRRAAEQIEIIFKERPDFFQFAPAIDYQERTSPSGDHILSIAALGPSEHVTLQLLSYKTVPVPLTVRSKDGMARVIDIQPQRVLPRWVNYSARFLLVVGLGFTAYWVIHAVIFLSRAVGVLPPA